MHRLLLVLLVSMIVQPALGQELVVQTHREGDAIVVAASVDVPAEVSVAWSVLTAYDHYAEFVPDLHYSRVVGRDARGLIVLQRGRARFLFLHHSVEATLAVAETPQRVVTSRMVVGSFRELDGRYELEPIEGGTRFTYAGRVVPGDAMPLWLTAVAMKSNVERQLGALAREMARRGEPSRVVQRPHQVAPAN